MIPALHLDELIRAFISSELSRFLIYMATDFYLLSEFLRTVCSTRTFVK